MVSERVRKTPGKGEAPGKGGQSLNWVMAVTKGNSFDQILILQIMGGSFLIVRE